LLKRQKNGFGKKCPSLIHWKWFHPAHFEVECEGRLDLDSTVRQYFKSIFSPKLNSKSACKKNFLHMVFLTLKSLTKHKLLTQTIYVRQSKCQKRFKNLFLIAIIRLSREGTFYYIRKRLLSWTNSNFVRIFL